MKLARPWFSASRSVLDTTLVLIVLLSAVGCRGTIEDAEPSEPASESEATAGARPARPAAEGGGAQQPSDPRAPSGAVGGAARPGDGAVSDACRDVPADPGPSPLRRLSPVQYTITLRDLVGTVPGLGAVLGSPSEPSELGLVQPDVAPVELETYQKAAETVAAYVAATPAKLQELAPCASGVEPRTCARTFVERFGARAYRAPLSAADDVDRHLALYDVGAKTSHAHGVELVVRGMLQSSRFLYRVELGLAKPSAPRSVRLSGHELAARLSYALWDTLPDASLAEAAEQGRLDTPEGVREIVDSMLADPRGSHVLRRFFERLLQLAKLDSLVKDERFYPEWNESDLPALLRKQAEHTLDDVLERQGGTLRALLTSSSVFVSSDLASYYDVEAGDSFERIELAGERASGILTLPALLSVLAKPGESSPIHRGKFVREALLCQTLPAPPQNIPKPPDVEAGVSTRERLMQHEADPACSGCHRLMDPIGFGLESFDGIGRHRSEDGGDAIDGKGELVATRDANGVFTGPRELGDRLAASAEVRECMARQWFRFALERFERDVDGCTLQQLTSELEEASADLRVLPSALLTSDAFMSRRPLDFEETP